MRAVMTSIVFAAFAVGLRASQVGAADAPPSVNAADKAAEKTPADKEWLQGFELSKEGKLDEAIAHTEKAIKLNPKHAAAEYNLGFFLSQKKRLAEAIMHTKRAIKLNPANPDAHFNLASFLHSTGKKDQAEKEYRETLRLQPANGSAHFNLGILLAARKSPEAAEHCLKAAELNPALAGPVCPQK